MPDRKSFPEKVGYVSRVLRGMSGQFGQEAETEQALKDVLSGCLLVKTFFSSRLLQTRGFG